MEIRHHSKIPINYGKGVSISCKIAIQDDISFLTASKLARSGPTSRIVGGNLLNVVENWEEL